MGCGACGPCGSTEKVVPSTSLSVILNELLNSYIRSFEQKNISESDSNLKYKQIHPCLSLEECKLIQGLIASTNGEIPSVILTTKRRVSSMLNEKSKAANSESPSLLMESQRIIWKIILFVPQPVTQSYVNHINIPEFKDILNDGDEVVKDSFYQISLDVNRTFPKVDSLNRNDLTILLKNIVNSFGGIGYTQGMNFYAGFLLLCGFNIKECYYLFHSLFTHPSLLLSFNFNNDFKMVFISNEFLANSHSQKLKDHFHNFGITEQIYSFSWFLCCFLYTLNPDVCVIIWDFMIQSLAFDVCWSGFATIINFGILIVELLEEEILLASSPEDVLEVLRYDKLNKKVTIDSICLMITKIKEKGSKYSRNELSKEECKSFVCRQTFKDNKEIHEILLSQPAYDKYLKEVFLPSRKISQLESTENDKKNEETEKTIEHIGNPNIIKICPTI